MACPTRSNARRDRFALGAIVLALLLAPVSPNLTPDLARSARAQGPQLIFDKPFEIKSLGLRVFLPEDSLVDLSRLQGGKTSVKILPQGEQQDWVIQIWNFFPEDPGLTLDAALENMIAEKQKLRTRKVGDQPAKPLVRVFERSDNLLVGPMEARRAYLDLDDPSSTTVTGYTLFRPDDHQFVIVQLDTIKDVFPRNREMYELLAAAIQFADADELNEQRAATLLAGESLLRRFSNDDFESVLSDEPRFFRVFRPSQTGDPMDAKEVGYQRITMRRGKAGEVDAKPEGRWRAGDRDEGFLVIVEARTLLDDAIADSVARFFLSDDRERELWSNDMVVRKGSAQDRWTESGIRSEGKLVVKTVTRGREPTSTHWDTLPESYISRVETYLLPKLVVRRGIEGDFGYYAYDSYLGKLSIRRDSLEHKAPGAWSMVTHASENSPAAGVIMDDEGLIIQRDLPGGEIVKPIEGDELRRLWARKGLPVN